MDEAVLFEIPIYLMPKKFFDEKVSQHFSRCKKIPCTVDGIESTTSKELKNLGDLKGQYNWKFNQIVGYIVITYRANTIWLTLFQTKEKRIPYCSTRKPFLVREDHPGNHFVIDHKTNEEILSNIRKELKTLQPDLIHKNRFIDLTVFENIAPYLDFNTLISQFCLKLSDNAAHPIQNQHNSDLS